MSFKVGVVYLISCTYTRPPKNKFAICVQEDKPLFFFINTNPRTHSQPESQIVVAPSELPFLKYDSYINTADFVTCVVPITCEILKEFISIPSSIREKIKTAVGTSVTLSPRFIKSITKNL